MLFPIVLKRKAPHDGEAVNSLLTYEAMATISDLREYMCFNPVLQNLSPNLSPFIVNAIALLALTRHYQGVKRCASSPPSDL